MVALLALMRPVFSSFSAFFLVFHRIQSSTQRMRSISSRRATTGREIWTPTMKIMFVTLFTVQLFSYFGDLIFPLSCAAGPRSSLSIPAAATSFHYFREELFRPKYLLIESSEHLEFIENHFYFIMPMIDTELFIFATTEVADYPFYGSDTIFSLRTKSDRDRSKHNHGATKRTIDDCIN